MLRFKECIVFKVKRVLADKDRRLHLRLRARQKRLRRVWEWAGEFLGVSG